MDFKYELRGPRVKVKGGWQQLHVACSLSYPSSFLRLTGLAWCALARDLSLLQAVSVRHLLSLQENPQPAARLLTSHVLLRDSKSASSGEQCLLAGRLWIVSAHRGTKAFRKDRTSLSRQARLSFLVKPGCATP